MKAKIATSAVISALPKGGPTLPKPNTALAKQQPYSWDLYRDGITQSALSTMQQCPEKFRLAIMEGLATNKFSIPIEFGNIVHAALDKLYTDFAKLSSINKAQDRMRGIMAYMHKAAIAECRADKLVTVGTEQQINEQYCIASVVLAHYLDKWFDEDKKRDWVALEQQFRLPLNYDGKTFDLLGKVDGVYREKSGLAMLETKTKGQIDEGNIMDKLPFDFQVFFYFLNASKLHKEKINTVLYNIVRRPQLRQKKDEDITAFCERISQDIAARPDFYFVRFKCTVNKKDTERWVGEFTQIIAELISRYENDLWYRRSTSCDAYGRCQFLKFCGHGNKAGLVTRKHAFPELQEI